MLSEGKKPTTSIPKTVKVKQLQKELKSETSKWQELGFQLQVPTDDLKKIAKDANKKSPKMCLVAAIEYWLTNGEDKTWQVIFDALEDDHGRLKSELENQYHADMEVTLNATQLVNLLEEVVPDWYMFGQDIDVPLVELKSFKDAKATDQCFSEMLQKWLNSGKATWEGLVEALIKINNRRLSKEIEKKYLRNIPDKDPKGQRVEWHVGIDEEELEEDEHFMDVLQAVTSVVKWEELGLALKLKSYILQEIRRDEQTVADRRKAMLRAWLREGEATWKSLCLALDNDVVAEKKLARDIARNHRVHGGNHGNGGLSQPVDQSENLRYPEQESMDIPAFDSNSIPSTTPSAPPPPRQDNDYMDTSSSQPPNTIQMTGPPNNSGTLPPIHVTDPAIMVPSSHMINPNIQQPQGYYDSSRIGHATMEHDMEEGGHHSFVHNRPPVPDPQHLPPGNPYHHQVPPGQAEPQHDMEEGGHHSFVHNRPKVPDPQHLPPGNPYHHQVPPGQAEPQHDMEEGGHHSFVHNRPKVPGPQHLPPGSPYYQSQYDPHCDMEKDGQYSSIHDNPPTSQNDIQASVGRDTQAKMVCNSEHGDHRVYQNTSSVYTMPHSVSSDKNN